MLTRANLMVDRTYRKMVGLGGFEPPTSPLSGVRSNQLSYRPTMNPTGQKGRGRREPAQATTTSRLWIQLMKGHEDGGKCSLEWRKLFLLVVTNRRFPPISLERR